MWFAGTVAAKFLSMFRAGFGFVEGRSGEFVVCVIIINFHLPP